MVIHQHFSKSVSDLPFRFCVLLMCVPDTNEEITVTQRWWKITRVFRV